MSTDQKAPATAKTAQQIALAAAHEIMALNYPKTPMEDNLSVIILRAIAEAVEATGAREALASCCTWQTGGGFIAQNAEVHFRFESCLVDKAITALEELGRIGIAPETEHGVHGFVIYGIEDEMVVIHVNKTHAETFFASCPEQANDFNAKFKQQVFRTLEEAWQTFVDFKSTWKTKYSEEDL